jgi:hypothetical protein
VHADFRKQGFQQFRRELLLIENNVDIEPCALSKESTLDLPRSKLAGAGCPGQTIDGVLADDGIRRLLEGA